MISQEFLKELMEYNPETGDFVWKVKRGRVSPGTIAGRQGTDGYIGIQINKKKYAAHRLAFIYMTGDLPEDEVDHINNDRTDNRWENLRGSSRIENSRNRRLPKNNRSGAIGVHFSNLERKWVAVICVNSVPKRLGAYKSFEAARVRRMAANIKYGFGGNHGKDLSLPNWR